MTLYKKRKKEHKGLINQQEKIMKIILKVLMSQVKFFRKIMLAKKRNLTKMEIIKPKRNRFKNDRKNKLKI